MGDEAGYSALIKSLVQRKKEFVINIHMPSSKGRNCEFLGPLYDKQVTNFLDMGYWRRKLCWKTIRLWQTFSTSNTIHTLSQGADCKYLNFWYALRIQVLINLGSYWYKFGQCSRRVAREIPDWQLTTLSRKVHISEWKTLLGVDNAQIASLGNHYCQLFQVIHLISNCLVGLDHWESNPNWAPELVMFRLWPEAVSQAKPSQNRPGQARPARLACEGFWPGL